MKFITLIDPSILTENLMGRTIYQKKTEEYIGRKVMMKNPETISLIRVNNCWNNKNASLQAKYVFIKFHLYFR